MKRYEHFIAGSDHPPVTQEWIDTDDPFTGRPWARIARGSGADVDAAVRAARDAFDSGPWPELSPSDRGHLIHELGNVIAAHAEALAELETRDNGKLFTEMHGQVQYIPRWFHYYGGLADKLEGTVIPIDKPGLFAFTRREPVGVTAILTPWNSPLLLLAWKLAPALAAGCTAVIKPSEYASASTVELVRLLTDGGLPAGVVNVVTGLGAEAGAPLVSHPLVDKISFTGSDTTGRAINQAAAADFKHVSLELGGKSPNIVFPDADLGAAVNGAISGIFAATGQSCIAGSRLLLQNEIHDEFVDRLTDLARTARLGDPRDPATQIGPVTTRPQFDKVLDYIEIARQEGAKVALGGRAASAPECGDGWFVEPTILTDVDNRTRIAQEEVFGPVLSVIRFEDEEDAVRIANDSRFGLGCGVWTGDIARAIRMSERVRAGTVWVNTYRVVSYMAPFGGFKHSGSGRENGLAAVDDYLESKTVWINAGAPAGNPFILG